MARLDQVFHVIGADAQNIAVHETGIFRVPFLQGRDQLVAMRIGRIKQAIDLHRPDFAVHFLQSCHYIGRQERHLLFRAIAHQSDRLAELLA